MENYKNLKLGGSADSERNRKQNLIEIAIKQKHTKKVDCFEDSSPGLHFRKISIPSELPGFNKKLNFSSEQKSSWEIAKSYIMKHLKMQWNSLEIISYSIIAFHQKMERKHFFISAERQPFAQNCIWWLLMEASIVCRLYAFHQNWKKNGLSKDIFHQLKRVSKIKSKDIMVYGENLQLQIILTCFFSIWGWYKI